MLGSLLLFVAVALLALAPSVTAVVVANAAVGLVNGSVAPALAAMLGLEAPARTKGTVFGWSASATSIGIGGGPLLTGVIAATAGVPVGLLVAGATGLLAAVALLAWGREPVLALGPEARPA